MKTSIVYFKIFSEILALIVFALFVAKLYLPESDLSGKVIWVLVGIIVVHLCIAVYGIIKVRK